MTHMKEVDEKSFVEFVNSNNVVAVAFSAPWCMPCNMMKPVFEKLSLTQPIAKLNIDQCANLAKENGVSTIPTLVFFKAGKAVKKMTGILNAQQINLVFAELKD